MTKTPQAMSDEEYNKHLDEVFSGNDFEKQSRQERRKAIVEYKDKPLPVYKYFKILAKELPPMMDKEKNPYDHEQMLRTFYKDGGLAGVKEYVSIVRGAAKEALGYGKEDDSDGFIRGEAKKETDKL